MAAREMGSSLHSWTFSFQTSTMRVLPAFILCATTHPPHGAAHGMLIRSVYGSAEGSRLATRSFLIAGA